MKKLILFLIASSLSFTTFAQDLKWENANKKEKNTKTDSDEKPDESSDTVPVREFEAAPYRVEVREGNLSMSQGSNYGFSMVLPDIKEKEVKGLWDDLMKEYGSRSKRVKKSSNELAGDVSIPSISGTGGMNIYSQIDKSGESVNMTVWFDMGNGKYLNSKDYPNSYQDAEALLQDFAVTVKRKSIQNQLDEEHKMLKELERDLGQLERKKEGLEKDIENWKTKIIEAEQSIAENERAQEEAQIAVKEQELKVQDVEHKLKSTH